MNTSLDTEPLAWTVAISRADAGPGDLTTYHKEIYIGQPSSLNLKEIATVSGCALIFTGATLQFGSNLAANPLEDENGSCADALPTQCVTDLMSEAQNLVNTTELQSGNLMNCATLAQFLNARMPSTCPSSFGSTDEISTPSLSGTNMSNPSTLSTCHPALSKDYSLTHLANMSASSEHPSSREAFEWLYGVTPVLTVFAPLDDGSSSEGPSISAAEAHLTCLKPMGNNYTTSATVVGLGSGISRTTALLYLFVALAGFGVLS
ncbi:uncharacterized protein Z518_08664 [Rhinocladiella mackenziei CBS 650.93]|uniref:Uncharacterized protein n=1 Tax=Rhinocladiella mackenziei CBS 650.93 TaxID=1442369 RepID=A0A0D2FL76_9EURO|nr:uncharacterized protein Z518_08664 [Rhinocladiella mackenziei CBS 650.93]KIX02722.1 hypothetical protein Z518_08664 [Rhinocladiella mackenziei CBS 650.93]